MAKGSNIDASHRPGPPTCPTKNSYLLLALLSLSSLPSSGSPQYLPPTRVFDEEHNDLARASTKNYFFPVVVIIIQTLMMELGFSQLQIGGENIHNRHS